jgi:hypothetical protein
MLLKTSLNNILLSMLFLAVNNIVQHCSGEQLLNNIVKVRNNMGSKILFRLVVNNIVTG